MMDNDPRKIRISKRDKESSTGEWFDDDFLTHKPEDTLYIRADAIWEHLISEGYQITVTLKDRDDE